MLTKQNWSSPELNFYGSVEDITEQRSGSVTKNGGSGDTITITIGGNSTVVAGGASGAAGGCSLVNISPKPGR
jgi:hypothetical protein